MKKLFLFLLLTTSACAQSPMTFEWRAGATVPPRVVRPFLIEAAKLGRFPVPWSTPTVTIVSDEFMQTTFCPGEDSCLIYGAFFDNFPDHILINEATPAWRRGTTIVHESAHYLQHLAGSLAPGCLSRSAAELEAHAISFRYAAKHMIAGEMTPPRYTCAGHK